MKSLSQIKIPQIFTVEAYIRINPAAPATLGQLQYIYEITRNTNYFAIALDNNYIKVIINGFERTYFQEWGKNTGWRYIGVTVTKQFVDYSTSPTAPIARSVVNIYIDRTQAPSFTVPSFFQDDQSVPSLISDVIGRNFNGVIRIVRLQSNMFCGASVSPMITTSKCPC